MRIFKVTTFTKWQKKEGITDAALIKAVEEIQNGLIDAQLGSGVIKKRVAKIGHGKRSSYRTFIATNKGTKWFFIFGFAKNEQENLHDLELETLRKYAQKLLQFNEAQIEILIGKNDLQEIHYEKK